MSRPRQSSKTPRLCCSCLRECLAERDDFCLLKSVSATLCERFKQHIGWHRVRVYIYILTDHFIALVRSFVLPSRLGGKTAVFEASGSLAGENERNPRPRSPFHRRFPATTFDNLLWIHLLLITANVTAVHPLHPPSTELLRR